MADRKTRFIFEFVTKQLTKGAKEATKALDSVEKGAKDADKATEKLGKQTKNTGAQFAKSGSQIKTSTIAVGNIIANFATQAIQQLGRVGEAVNELVTEYDSGLAEVEAITGIAGERLDFIGDRALENSARTGVAFGDQIEAYKLLASQLAQKIDFGTEDGLMELALIQEQAVTLSESAGIDLQTAVMATARALNQFGLEASESEENNKHACSGVKVWRFGSWGDGGGH